MPQSHDGKKNIKSIMSSNIKNYHLQIWLCDKDAPKTPTDYDKFVKAEFPDPETHPELFKLVKTHMVHGKLLTYHF